jgi:hypothetical protein
MVELSLKNDICIGMKYVFVFFMIFQIFFKKMQILNYSMRLSMRREIQNCLIFQPNPESFCRAMIFTYKLFYPFWNFDPQKEDWSLKKRYDPDMVWDPFSRRWSWSDLKSLLKNDLSKVCKNPTMPKYMLLYIFVAFPYFLNLFHSFIVFPHE